MGYNQEPPPTRKTNRKQALFSFEMLLIQKGDEQWII
jgi:hypothetical protein